MVGFQKGSDPEYFQNPQRLIVPGSLTQATFGGLHLGHFGQFTKYLCFQTGFTPPCNRYLLSSIVVSRNLEF